MSSLRNDLSEFVEYPRINSDYYIYDGDEIYVQYVHINTSQESKNAIPLTCWNYRKMSFLTVSQVALNILSIAVTSVPNERTFSTAGNLITKRRNRMSNPIIQASICLNSIFNSKFYNLK